MPHSAALFPPAVCFRCWNILPTAYICFSPGHRHVPEPALSSGEGLKVLLPLLWGSHGMWPLSSLFPAWKYLWASAFSVEQCCTPFCPVLPSLALLLYASFTYCISTFSFLSLKRQKTALPPSICSVQQRDRKLPGKSVRPNKITINEQTLVQVLACCVSQGGATVLSS